MSAIQFLNELMIIGSETNINVSHSENIITSADDCGGDIDCSGDWE